MTPIVRQRLFDLLEQRRRQPCVWVSAAAGYGKTSLLVSYLNWKQEKRLWHGLRPADTDLVRFFQYLSQTLKTQFPTLDLPEISLINLVGPEAFGEVFFTALKDTTLTLVLDDYHYLADDSLVHNAIGSGLELLGDGRWLIASRRPPPMALTRLVANGVIDLIATDELKFTLDETRQLLSQHNLEKFSDEQVKTLHRISEGWVAGLVLLMKQQQLRQLPKNVDGLVFQYFRHEILSQFDSPTRRFLMICALIPDIIPSQAEELTGQSDAQQCLERIARACEFIKYLPNDPSGYRFHALFRDVLWEMSASELGLEALDEYKRRAIEILVKQHQFDTAVELLADLEEWAALIDLIENQAESLLSQGCIHTLRTWIKTIPNETAADTIWLAYWEARCDLPFAPAQTRRSLESLFTQFKHDNDIVGIYLTWSYIVESYFIERNEVEPLDEWLQVVTELKQHYPVPDVLSVRSRVIYAQYIIASIRTNNPDDSLDDEMISLLRSALPADQKTAFATMIVFRIAWLNKGRERCIEVRAIIQQLLTDEDVSPMDRFVWNMSGIIYDYLFNEKPPSLSRSLTEARNIGERHGFTMLWHTYQLIVTQTYCIEGRVREAEQLITPLLSGLCNLNLNNYGHLKRVEAHFHIASGRPEQAMDCAEESLRTAQQINPSCYIQGLLTVSRAAVELDDRKKAVAYLARARRICRNIGNCHLEFSACMLLALTALRAGRRQRAIIFLRPAFARGQAQGYRRYLLQTPNSLTHLCALSLDADIYPDYAKALIRANCLKVPDGQVGKSWPRSVRILALGALQVEINDQPLVFNRKAQAKPMEMLKALVFNEGRPLGIEKVALALWPDANAQQAKNNTKSTLHRLRKLLGYDAVVLQDGCVRLNQDCCWLDVTAFRRLLEKSSGEVISTAVLEDTLRLYRGPLLGDDEIPEWAIHLRLELDTYFLNNVQCLARCLIAEDNPNKAIDWLLRGLEIDPFSETLALVLIKLYLQLNRKSEARVFYHSFRDRLKNELEIEPGDALESVYASMN